MRRHCPGRGVRRPRFTNLDHGNQSRGRGAAPTGVKEFGKDMRLVGRYELNGTRGNWRLWAEARDSSSLRTADDGE